MICSCMARGCYVRRLGFACGVKARGEWRENVLLLDAPVCERWKGSENKQKTVFQK